MNTLRALLVVSLVTALHVYRASAAAPTPLTLGFSNVTSGAATLIGSVNPNSATTRVFFEWGTTTNYGTVTATQNVGNGSSVVVVTNRLTNLTAVTTYHFRLAASNSSGWRWGTNISFTTVGPPSAVTTNPTAIMSNSVTLNGAVTPNGLATAAWLEWGLTTNYGNATAIQPLGTGTAPVQVSVAISNLLSGSNYHYRVVGSNSLGTSYGLNVSVMTTPLLQLFPGESWSYTFHDLPFYQNYYFPDAPMSRLTYTYAPGSVASNTVMKVELFMNSTAEVAALTSFITNGTGGFIVRWPASVWSDLQGAVRFTLLSGSAVINGLLIQEWSDRSLGYALQYQNGFTPTKYPQPPTLGTQVFTNMGPVSVLAQVQLNPNNLPTSVHVQWGTTTNLGFSTGTTNVDFDYVVPCPIWVTNLAPATAYYARLVASNSAGVAYGPIETFQTPTAVDVATVPANGRTVSSATLNALVTLKGFATTAYFEWGTTTNYGQVTPGQSLGTFIGATNIAASLSGLALNSTYHFRAVAIAQGHTVYGADLVFQTALPPTNLVVTNLATADVIGAMEQGGTVIFATSGEIALSNKIEIANDLVIDATGQSITFSGSGSNRLFDILPGTSVRMTNLTFTNGFSAKGGAIFNQGDLLASGCVFQNNVARGTNGHNGTNGLTGVTSPNAGLVTPGGHGENGTDGQSVCGGAIYSDGPLRIVGCAFLNNQAVGGRGGNGGNGGPGGWVYQGITGAAGGNGGRPGRGGDATGGAIFAFSSISAQGCLFSNSVAVGGQGGTGGNGGKSGGFSTGGGSSQTGGLGGAVMGGAIYSYSDLQVSDSVFALNRIFGGLGGTGSVSRNSSEFWFPERGGQGGSAIGGALWLFSGVVSSCTFTQNQAVGGNGGATGRRLGGGSSFSQVTGGANGGSANAGSLHVNNSALVQNCLIMVSVSAGGSGSPGDETTSLDPAYRGGTGGRGAGGGVSVSGTAVLVNDTFVGNLSSGGGGGLGGILQCPQIDYFGARGGNGGSAFGGDFFLDGTAAFTNCTLYGGAVAAGRALIREPCGPPTNYTSSSYLSNHFGINGQAYGASLAVTNGTLQIVNSIIGGASQTNAYGTIVDLGRNISSGPAPAWTSGTSVNNTDPLLMPLANNGGPTLTMALRVGSPALNTADCASAPAIDQRGFPRPNGAGCDIGAYEGPGVTWLEVVRESPATNVIRHLAEPGRNYRLERTADFTVWSPVATNQAPGGGVLEFRVPAAVSPSFFRVLAQ